MLDLKGIKNTMKKLKKDDEPGEIQYIDHGRRERRYSYYLKGIMVFTFGLTKSSRANSIKFNYVPEQMHLKRSEYRKLHDCPMSKKEYNEKLIQSKII